MAPRRRSISVIHSQTDGSGLSGLDVVNLFSAASSIILAIVALVLSVFFFVQSKKDAERSEQSAHEISSSVAGLRSYSTVLSPAGANFTIRCSGERPDAVT
jgi:hypothetical protein